MTHQTISHYRILERLGAGGMGVVYKARDTRLDRLVALKVLPPELVADSVRQRGLAVEAKAASALNHPNIITIYDVGTEPDSAFIAMEYLPGVTLAQLLGRRALPLDEVLGYAIQIAEALAAAHTAGIVHRDLKPGNIMVSEDGRVKLLDFGLAKLLTRSRTAHDPALTTLTLNDRSLAISESGVILGTAAYMSPEQASGNEVDARSDIFSFGIVLYEMLTRERPFRGDTAMDTVAAILREQPKPPSSVAPGLSPALDRIVATASGSSPRGASRAWRMWLV